MQYRVDTFFTIVESIIVLTLLSLVSARILFTLTLRSTLLNFLLIRSLGSLLPQYLPMSRGNHDNLVFSEIFITFVHLFSHFTTASYHNVLYTKRDSFEYPPPTADVRSRADVFFNVKNMAFYCLFPEKSDLSKRRK